MEYTSALGQTINVSNNLQSVSLTSPSVNTPLTTVGSPAGSSGVYSRYQDTTSQDYFRLGHVQYSDPLDSTVPNFIRSGDLMTLDPDPSGDKTARWSASVGGGMTQRDIAGLTVFGKPMSREQLSRSEAGRQLLNLTTQFREGHRRNFLDAITDFQWSDLPFVGLFASVGGSISDAVTVSDTMKKLQNGEAVSDDELIKTRLYMAQQEYQSNGTWGATVGDIIRAAPGFMAEFFATGSVAAFARAGGVKLAGQNVKALTSLAVNRANKTLARELAEDGIKREVVKKFGEDLSTKALREKVRELGAGGVKQLTDDLAKSLESRLVDQFSGTLGTKGIKDETTKLIARNLAEASVKRATSKLGASSAFTQFATGLAQSAREWTAAGFLDFGPFGTESSTVLFGAHNTAGAALKDAIGTMLVEAPLKGSMQYGMNLLFSEPIALVAGNDGRTVSTSQLAIQESALLTHNKQLMDSAEAISRGMNLLEYVSENSGRGFSNLFRSVGLATGVAKPALKVVEGELGGLLVETKAAEAGGALRSLIRKAIGSVDDYSRATADTRITSVRNAVARAAKANPSAGLAEISEAEAARIASGDLSGVTNEALKAFIGDDVGAFLKRAIKEETAQKVSDATHKSYFQYVMADWMVRHNIGPDDAMDAFQRMGYDGIVEEMMEERYSDFAKGLFGLDEYNNETFGSRLKQAFENLFPGWDQLTAEAVGFAVPMVTRSAVMRIQHALGGASELQRIRTTAANFQAANNGLKVVETTIGSYLDNVNATLNDLQTRKDSLLSERQDLLDSASKENITDPEELKRITADVDRQVEEIDKISKARTESRDRVLRVNSITDLAAVNRDAVMFLSVADDERTEDTKGKLRTERTSDQLARDYGAKQAFVSDAWIIGKAMYDSKGQEGDRQLPWYKKAAGKILGIAASVVTGDPALAMRGYAEWAAVDEGLDPLIASKLEETYKTLREATKNKILDENKNNGKLEGYIVTEDEIWDRMQDQYKKDAAAIAEAHLALNSVKMFSETDMRDQAVLYKARTDGWTIDLGTKTFSRKSDNGTDEVKSFAQFYEDNKDSVDNLRDRIAKATMALLSNGSIKSSQVASFVRLPVNSPIYDKVATSLALRMAGFSDTTVVRTLSEGDTIETALATGAATLNSGLLTRVAEQSSGADGVVNYSAVDERDILDIASQLRIPVRVGTDKELNELRKTVIDLSRQLASTITDSANVRVFEKKLTGEHRHLSSDAYKITVTKRNGGWWLTGDVKEGVTGYSSTVSAQFDTLEKAREFLSSHGFRESKNANGGVMLTETTLISSSDPLLLAIQYGKGFDYLSRTMPDGKDQKYVHPRLRKNSDGSYRYSVTEAADVERRERILADMYARYKEDISKYPGASTAAKHVAYKNAKEAHDIRYNETTGYVKVLDDILESLGVVTPRTTSLMSYFSGLSDKYMAVTSSFNAPSGTRYISVDFSNCQDYSAAVLQSALTNAFSRYRRFLTKGAPFRNVFTSFANVVYQIARQMEYSQNITEEQRDALKHLREDLLVYRDSPSPRLFAELASSMALFTAEHDKETKHNSTVHSVALQLVAERARNSDQFIPFFGLVDLMLGGDGFAFVTAQHRFGAERKDLPLRGIAKYMALFNNDDLDSLRTAINNFKPCGKNFMDFVTDVNHNANATSREVPAPVQPASPTAKNLMPVLQRLFADAKFETVADLNKFFATLANSTRENAELTATIRNSSKSVQAIFDNLKREKTERENELAKLKADYESAKNANEKNVSILKQELQRKAEVIAKLNSEITAKGIELEELRKAKEADLKGGQSLGPAVPSGTSADNTPDNPVLTADIHVATDTQAASKETTANKRKRLRQVRSKLELATDLSIDDDIVTHIDYVRVDDENGSGEYTYAPVVVDDPVVDQDLNETSREFGAWTIGNAIRSVEGLALADKATFESFAQMARSALPVLPVSEIENLYRVYLTQKDNVRLLTDVGVDEPDGMPEGVHSESNRGYGDKSVAAYEDETLNHLLSLAPFVSPNTGRGLQAFMEAVRTDVDRLRDGVKNKSIKNLSEDVVNKIHELFNPRLLGYADTKENRELKKQIDAIADQLKELGTSVSGNRAALEKQRDELTLKLYESTSATEREAVWRSALNSLDSDIGGESFDRVIQELLRPSESGDAMSAQTAFLLVFLRGLSKPKRMNLMTLCANSAVCSRVRVISNDATDDEGKLIDPGLELRASTGRFSSIGELSVTGSFNKFTTMTSAQVKSAAKRIEELYNVNRDKFTDIDFESDKKVQFKTLNSRAFKNFRVIADILGQVLGHESPLVQVLTSRTLQNYYREGHQFSKYGNAYDHLRSAFIDTRSFYVNDKGRRVSLSLPTMLKSVVDILNDIASDSSFSGDAPVLTDDPMSIGLIRRREEAVSRICVNAFATGTREDAGALIKSTTAGVSTSWMILLSDYTSSLPETVTPAELIPERSNRASASVAISSRGVIPAISRWMDLPISDKNSFAYFAKNFMPGERGERLRAMSDAEFVSTVLPECRQSMTWPNSAHTPILAKNLSKDYDADEVLNACERQFNRRFRDGEPLVGVDRVKKNIGTRWYVPIFSGDHSSSAILQFPTTSSSGENGDLASNLGLPFSKESGYTEFADFVGNAIGLGRLGTDAKRSALTCLEAPGVSLRGCRRTKDGSLTFGETRVHILFNYAEDFASKEGCKQEALIGTMVGIGYGLNMQRMIASDPRSQLAKLHYMSASGVDMTMLKALTSIVDNSPGSKNGAYLKGSVERAMSDYLLKFRQSDSDISTSIMMDLDGYKVGPGVSKLMGVLTGKVDKEGKPERIELMKYIYAKLEGVKIGSSLSVTELDELLGDGKKAPALADGASEQAKAENERFYRKGTFAWRGADGKDTRVTIADVLGMKDSDGNIIGDGGIKVNVVPGLGDKDSGRPALDFSYVDNSLMSYAVANVSHEAAPSNGRSPRNYMIDAATMATSMLRAGMVKGEAEKSVKQLLNLIANWGLAASAMETDESSIEALRNEDRSSGLQELIDHGEDPYGLNAEDQLAYDLFKRLNKAFNMPMYKVDAALVSCGAVYDEETGKIIDHTTDKFLRLMHKGSRVYTASEAKWRGVTRSLGLGQINVRDNGFRYGWHLDRAAFAKAYGVDENLSSRELCELVQSEIEKIHQKDLALRAADKLFDTSDDEVTTQKVVDEAVLAAHEARRKFTSCFVDHHGQRVSEIKCYADEGANWENDHLYNTDSLYCYSVSFDDLFVAGNGTSRVFDRSAFYFGDTGYGLLEGEQEATDSDPVFLAGSTFGLPRTPSYNGSMWLQTLRAFAPARMDTNEDGSISVGYDATVIPDPQSLKILGCDHDGDKAQCYLMRADDDLGTSDVRYLPSPTETDENGIETSIDLKAGEFTENVRTRRNYLKKLAELDFMFTPARGKSDQGESYNRFMMSTRHRNVVSNAFVQGLFDMARALPVDNGDTESDFYKTSFANGTKARPVNDAAWARLKKYLDTSADFFKNGGTVASAKIGAHVATSSQSADKARGTIVALASVLHIAQFSGKFRDTIFRGWSDNARVNVQQWVDFMYRIDGISNATFDDIKEQICKKLGWTSGTMDTVLVDLCFSGEKAPTTDEEFVQALIKYTESVRDRKSRYYMMVSAEPAEGDPGVEAIHNKIRKFFRGQDAKSKRSGYVPLTVSRANVEAFFGVTQTRDDDGFLVYKRDTSVKVDSRVKRVLNALDAARLEYNKAAKSSHKTEVTEAALLRDIVTGVSERRGVNPMSGYMYYMFTKLAVKGTDGAVLDKEANDMFTWMYGRKALQRARQFANAVNYTKAEPGNGSKIARRDSMNEVFDEVMADSDGGDTINNLLFAMNSSTKLAYSASSIATTLGRGGWSAELRGHAIQNLADQIASRGIVSNSARDLLVSLMAAKSVPTYDLLQLQANQQMIPQFIAALRTMSRAKSGTELFGTTEQQWKTMRAIANATRAEGELGSMSLRLRRGIESMFSVMYNMVASSLESSNCPAFSYFFMREAHAWETPGEYSGGETRRSANNKQSVVAYNGVRSILPFMRSKDAASRARAKMYVQQALDGVFDPGGVFGSRNNKFTTGPRGATSFVLSVDNLDEFSKESLTEEVRADLKVVRVILDQLAEANDNNPVEITPSSMFSQLLPLYTTFTSRATANGSLFGLIPGIYEKISKEQVRMYSGVLEGLDHPPTPGLGVYDAACATQVAPLSINMVNKLVKGTSLKRSDLVFKLSGVSPEIKDEIISKLSVHDSNEFPDADFEDRANYKSLKDKLVKASGARTNPGIGSSRSYMLDILNDDMLFQRLHEFTNERLGPTNNDEDYRDEPEEPRTTPANVDQRAKALASCARTLVSSWADVEYKGGTTFTIKARSGLRGSAATRFGNGARVDAVITVNVGADKFTNHEIDVNSPEVMASFCMAAPKLGLQVSDLMRLTEDERRALFTKYLRGGTSVKGAGANFSLALPSWQVSAEGLLTLASTINVGADGKLSDVKGAMYHEFFHSMIGMFRMMDVFSDKDVETFRDRFGDPRDGVDELFDEEAAAEEFRRYVASLMYGKENPRVDGTIKGAKDSKGIRDREVRGIFRRLLDAINAFLNAITSAFQHRNDDHVLFDMVINGYAAESESKQADVDEFAESIGTRERFFRTLKAENSGTEMGSGKFGYELKAMEGQSAEEAANNRIQNIIEQPMSTDPMRGHTLSEGEETQLHNMFMHELNLVTQDDYDPARKTRTSAVTQLIKAIVDLRTNGEYSADLAPVLETPVNDPEFYNASQTVRWQLKKALRDPISDGGEGTRSTVYTSFYHLGRALFRDVYGAADAEDINVIQGATSDIPFTQRLMSDKKVKKASAEALQKIEHTAKSGVNQFLRLSGVKGKKADTLRNDLYMGLLSCYGNRYWGIRMLKHRTAVSRTRSYYTKLRSITGEYQKTGAAVHVSSSDYVGFLMASGWEDVSTYVNNLRQSLERTRERYTGTSVESIADFLIEKLSAFESIDNTTLLSNGAEFRDNLSYFLRDVYTGIRRGEFDEKTGMFGDYVEDHDDDASELAQENRERYKLTGPEAKITQQMLKDCASTLLGVAASVKFFREIGVQPGSFMNSAFTGKSVTPLEYQEIVKEFAVGSEQLLNDEEFTNINCQPSFVLANIDEWYAASMPRMFGNSTIRDTFMKSSREFRGLVSNLTNTENFIANLFGVSRREGRKILKLVTKEGKFEMADGFYTRVKNGKKYIGFNVQNGLLGDVTDIEFTEDEYRTVDMFLKACAVYANGGTKYLTGVNGVKFHYNNTFIPNESLYENWEDVKARVEKFRTDDGKYQAVPPALMALYRIGLQLHKEFTGTVESNVSGKPSVNGYDLYKSVVNGMCAAVRTANEERKRLMETEGTEMSDKVYNDLVLRDLEAQGLIVTSGYEDGQVTETTSDGLPLRREGVICLDVRKVEQVCKRSSAFQKLRDAGRVSGDLFGGEDPLTFDYVKNTYMAEWNKLRRLVKDHPWLTRGDGALFNNFDTPFPHFQGSGLFMYHANRLARDSKTDKLTKLGKHELTFIGMLNNGDLIGSSIESLSAAQLAMIHDYFNTKEEGNELLSALVSGAYAEGTAASIRTGLVVPLSATYLDVAGAIYRKQLERRLMDIEGRRAEDFDDEGAIERMIQAWEAATQDKGDMTLTGHVGLTDEQMYRMHGVLPANMQIGHKVHLAMKNIADAMFQRSVLVNMLFTKGIEGNPVFYMNPAEFAVEAGGIPDSVWAAAAKWWAQKNPGTRYDTTKSGVENARAIYSVLSGVAKENEWKLHGRKFQTLAGDEITDVKSIDAIMCQADDPADDNVSGLNRIGGRNLHTFDGGEAIGYARRLFQTGRVPSGAKLQWMDHTLAWCKSLNVACSFFFPIATKWESPTAAVGALATMGSNFSPEFVRKHHDMLNAVQKAFTLGQKDGWVDENFIGFKDIVDMMDSNDPFLADLVMWTESIGITMSTRLNNPMETGRGYLENDLKNFTEKVREITGSTKLAKAIDGTLDVMLRRGSEKAFTYAMNATKLAVTCQVAMKLRNEARKQGKAFDPIRDLAKYAAYIDSEVGGVDTLRYAWAHPMMQRMLNRTFFSWQWTRTAWEAGGGPIFEDILFGGHTLNKETRQYLIGRWLRMFGSVMIGVPAMTQVLIKGLALAMGRDDDDDKWFTWENEDKAAWTAYDITPLMKALADHEPVARLAGFTAGASFGYLKMGAFGGVLGGLMGATGTPIYTGGDAANSATRNRRYYQHFGKQGWEFFRWFDDPVGQFMAKQNMPTQRLLEGLFGRNLAYLDRELPFNDMSFAERWLNPTADSAIVNMAKAFLPFTVNGVFTFGDAGILSMFGPVQMGASVTTLTERIKDRMYKWALNDRSGYAFGREMTKSHKREFYAHKFADILDEARRNGVKDIEPLVTRAVGQVTPRLYGKLADEVIKDNIDDIDSKEVRRIGRALSRTGSTYQNAIQSLEKRLRTVGVDYKRLPRERRMAMEGAVRTAYRDPFATGKFDY